MFHVESIISLKLRLIRDFCSNVFVVHRLESIEEWQILDLLRYTREFYGHDEVEDAGPCVIFDILPTRYLKKDSNLYLHQRSIADKA